MSCTSNIVRGRQRQSRQNIEIVLNFLARSMALPVDPAADSGNRPLQAGAAG
jgi:hypothetical protein